MSTDRLPVHAPELERTDEGGIARFIMPEPICRGGFRAVVRYTDFDRRYDDPFIVLRGAVLTSMSRDGVDLVEVVVHGQSGWVDDEGDRVKVAALQLAVQSTSFMYDTIELLAYMGEPGAVDYSDFEAVSAEKALPYWPRNRSDTAPEVADRNTVPDSPVLVRVSVVPEWDTPVLPV